MTPAKGNESDLTRMVTGLKAKDNMEFEIEAMEPIVFEGSSILEFFSEDPPLIDLGDDKCWPESF